MSQSATANEAPLVLVGAQNGVALIPSATPLTRLNYFDGKFLRAEDLNREQQYLRSLVHLSNQTGGSGIVHGFTARLQSGGMLELSPGLAIDPAGRLLHLPHSASVGLAELIERTKASASTGESAPNVGEGVFAPCETAAVQPPSATTVFPTDLYLIALVHAEALCGEEDVYGKLCEDACVTSTDRPFRTEGVVVRAIPLTLCPPTCGADWLTATHRRSQVASAYFATERALQGKEISGTRLRLDLWCRGAEAAGGSFVPVALVSMNGGTVEFLDAWAARRERIEAPPRRYWAWQTMMRPWNVFIAQVLQFQCHLHSALTGPASDPGASDPCEPSNEALRQAVSLLEEMEAYTATDTAYSGGDDPFRPGFLSRISQLKSAWSGVLESAQAPAGTRILVTEGIVELPPAGYLPVSPGGVDVNTQVRRLLGEGVDLRFCSVRPDYVAHALEEAQHLERICLLRGIENPQDLEEVDILVPNGTPTSRPVETGMFFETTFGVFIPSFSFPNPNAAEAPSNDNTDEPVDAIGVNAMATPAATAPTTRMGPQFRGAGRGERLATGGGAFHFAGTMVQTVEQLVGRISQEYDRVDPERSFRNTGGGFDIGELNLSALMARLAGAAKRSAPAMMEASAINIRQPSMQGSRVAPGLWTTFRCERDPFAMSAGESSEVRIEAALGASVGDYLLGGRLHLQGSLFCDQTGGSAGVRTVKGRGTGWVHASARIQAGSQSVHHQAPARFIPVAAEMELRPETGGGGKLVITVTTKQGLEFSVTTDWKGSPVVSGLSVTVDLIDTIAAAVRRQFADDPQRLAAFEQYVKHMEEANPQLRMVEIATGRLQENPEVAKESHADHARAIRGLRTIEQALDEDGFRGASEQLLFPPALEETGEKRFLASRDWVLFHRRRVSSCDCCRPERKVVAPPRRFRVYEITAPEPVSIDEIRRAIDSGESLEKYAQVVGITTFEGESARLAPETSTDAIREGWRLAEPAAAILFGGAASAGAAIGDPDALGEQRVGRVVDIVRPITPLDPGADFDVFPFVPAGLSAEGVDGVIFLVTVPAAVGTQTHRVVALRDQGMMNFTIPRMQQGELGEVVAENHAMGDVVFRGGTDEAVDGTLEQMVSRWRARYPSFNVERAIVVLPADGSIDQALAERQGGAIAGAIAGTLTEPTIRSSEDVFEGIDAIVVLEPTQRVID